MQQLRPAVRPAGNPLPCESSLGSDPFLKWAGGKRWLMQRYQYLFPKTYNAYIEPFLGSGACFFALRPKISILSDLNPDLINAYNAVKLAPSRVIAALEHHHRHHNADHYYEVRSAKAEDSATRAADFIYLNRTCWNGLYRVNKLGQFNVPIGTKDKVLRPTDDFGAVAKVLSRAEILCSDFKQSVDKARRGDFLFVDPPYTVMHDNNGFVKYNENIFSWADQCRLADSLRSASQRGAMIMVTNANHYSIRDLYSDFMEITEVYRNSVISGSNRGRIKATELVIRNYL